MARSPATEWLRRVAKHEVLRAYQLRRVAFADGYLVRRRYLSDGRVLELAGTGPGAEDAEEREIARWTDLAAERTALASAGWEVAPRR